MPTSSCETCSFFSAAEKECRIRAPNVIPVSVRQESPAILPIVYGQTKWPAVTANDWCGEWKKK
jgi:hypothetical protein